LTPNIGQLFSLRIDIDHLDLVDNPIATGENSGAR
jgi:hypothetical protein